MSLMGSFHPMSAGKDGQVWAWAWHGILYYVGRLLIIS